MKGLINHLAKACFVQGLRNDRIKTIVPPKGETALLSTCIDAALEEELTILSAREGGVLGTERLRKNISRASPSISTSKQWRQQ